MKRRFLLLALVPLILGGCEFLNPGVDPEEVEDVMTDNQAENCAPYLCMDGSTHPRCTEDGQVINYFADPCMTAGGEQTKGMFTTYNDDVLANGETKVLFFYAAWCPECRAVESDLNEWYGDQGFPLSVYRVNYDTETELKQKYGVVYQHTFVKVDGQGNVISKIQGPSDEQLMEMLK